MQKPHFSKFFLLAIGLACLPVYAQDANSPVADNPAIPADEFNRGTPYRSAEGFLATAGTGDYEIAAQYLDLRNLRGEASELIDDPTGRSYDNLAHYHDSIGAPIRPLVSPVRRQRDTWFVSLGVFMRLRPRMAAYPHC